jgi:lipopolysaccharide heptosyltransferase II
MRVLIIQTAFAGDLILTLPLIQECKRLLSDAVLDVLCIPSTAGLLENHVAINKTFVYDKRSGFGSFKSIVAEIRSQRYDIVISPHRSFRTTMLSYLSGANKRISFNTSAWSFLYSALAEYNSGDHEVSRNLSLLTELGKAVDPSARPQLYPGAAEKQRLQALLSEYGIERYVCVAPGSVWATKRWTKAGFSALAIDLCRDIPVLLIGGGDDAELCESIATSVGHENCVTLAGKLSWLETAALVETAAIVVSNDSAPVHVASAMGTAVLEIYGATSPEYGFSPWEVEHEIVERKDLECKPCAIHGGKSCPIGTFECMEQLPAAQVIAAARKLIK